MSISQTHECLFGSSHALNAELESIGGKNLHQISLDTIESCLYLARRLSCDEYMDLVLKMIDPIPSMDTLFSTSSGISGPPKFIFYCDKTVIIETHDKSVERQVAIMKYAVNIVPQFMLAWDASGRTLTDSQRQRFRSLMNECNNRY